MVDKYRVRDIPAYHFNREETLRFLSGTDNLGLIDPDRLTDLTGSDILVEPKQVGPFEKVVRGKGLHITSDLQ